MAPTTRAARAAAEKKGKSSGIKTTSLGSSVGKQTGKTSAKSLSRTGPRGGSPIKQSFTAAEENRGAIPPAGTALDLTSFSESSNGLFKPGFLPFIDNTRQPSSAGVQSQRRGTLFPTSPVRVSPATESFKTVANGSLPPMNNASQGLFSPAARGLTSASPRQSLFGSVSHANGVAPAASTFTRNSYPSSPGGSNLGRIASVSGSPRLPKTPGTPLAPRSPFASGISQPAKITVSASTKQEAEGVLARQQLVRESLFELREILTNLNWKVQQFEALADKAEKDVIWDTVSADGNLGQSDQNQQGPESKKRLRFSFDKAV